MIHLNTVGNASVRNEVIFKTCNVPGADIAEPRIPKPSRPAKARIGGKRFERLVGSFDDAGRGIGIILGNETPNAPKFILDARIKDKFRHQSGILLFVYGVGETLPRHKRPRLARGGQCFVATAFPVLQVSLALGAAARLGLP